MASERLERNYTAPKEIALLADFRKNRVAEVG